MPFAVLLTDDAAHDLEELYDFIARHDAPEKAEYVLQQIEKAFTRLSESPERGAWPKELLALGIDVLTSGNHIWDRREIMEYLPQQPRLGVVGVHLEILRHAGIVDPVAVSDHCAMLIR